jgi:hypothetical protein
MKECPACGRTFVSNASLKYHLDHNVCQKSNNTCYNCEKKFVSKSSYVYHITHGVCLPTTTTMTTQQDGTKLRLKLKKPRLTLKLDHKSKREIISELEDAKNELLQTQKQLTQIESKYQSLKENPQSIHNNNNIIFFPSAFGDEDINTIRQKLGDILGPMIKYHPFKSIPILFSSVHNNDKLPEYHNVYVSSERSNYAMVSDGKSFKYQPKKTVIDQIIETKRSLLNQYIDDNGDQLGEKVLKKYEEYQDLLDENSDFKKELEVEIGGLLLDMKAVIANDEKTRHLLDKVNEGNFELHTEDTEAS